MKTEAPPIKKPRTRRPRSHRGCTSCKTAKRKCTEEQPACSFCVKNNLECKYDIDSLFRFEQFEPSQPTVKNELSSPAVPRKRKPEGGKKSPDKITEARRRSKNQSISSISSLSEHATPSSFLSVSPQTAPLSSPALSSKRSSYCTAPEDWSVGSDISSSPRFQVIEGAEDADLEDIFSSTLAIRAPIADGHSIDDLDLPYFDYFLQRMPQLMSFVDLFPSVVRDVFARSIDHAALRHSILSVSTMLATGNGPLDLLPSRHYHHKQKALQLLQGALGGSPKDLTENDAIAIFLLLWLDVNSGSSMSATHHLRGLHQVLQQVQNNTRESTAGFGGVSALLMLVWRSAYRMEALLGVPFYEGGPIFPPAPPGQSQLHRGWISAATDQSTSLSTEWAIAKFELDDLAHRGAILARIANKDRKDNPEATTLSTEIMADFSELLNDLQEWRFNPLVQEAERKEKLCQIGQLPAATIPQPFLDHPPLPIYSEQFVHMMNHWRAIQIYMSLILWPPVGPNPPSSGRYQTGVDICRSFASLQSGISGETWCLTLAGIAFGGESYYAEESRWMMEKQEFVLEGFRFPIVISVRQMMNYIWNSGMSIWDIFNI